VGLCQGGYESFGLYLEDAIVEIRPTLPYYIEIQSPSSFPLFPELDLE